MSRLLPLGLLPFAVILAVFLRYQAGDEAGVVGEDAAAHLRRVHLSLAEGATPLADAALLPSGDVTIPDPPYLDQGWAMLVSRTGIESQSIARAFGPWTSALVMILAAWLVMTWRRDEYGGLAAVTVAFLFAVSPTAIEVGAAGRVDTSLLEAAIALVAFTILAQTAHAGDRFDWIQGGLAGGLFTGVAFLFGPLSLLILAGMTFGYWRIFQRLEGEDRDAARRTGLLFVLAATVITSLVGGSLPEGTIVGRWMRGGSALAFAAGLPFLVAAALTPGRRAVPARAARFIGALAAAVLLPLGVWDIWPLMTEWVPDPTPGEWHQVDGALYFAATLHWFVYKRQTGLLVFAALLISALTGSGGAACIGLALAAGLCFSGVGPVAERLDPKHRTTQTRLGGAVFAVLVLVAGGLVRSPDSGVDSEITSGLRRLRVLPGAPVSSSTARPTGAVLARPELGHRLVHEGWAAPVASGYGHGWEEAEHALAAGTPAELAERMRQIHATRVLVGEGFGVTLDLEDSPSFERLLPGTPAVYTLASRKDSGPRDAPTISPGK